MPQSTNRPAGPVTRAISASAAGQSNQWNASATNTASTLPSGNGIRSALPSYTSACGTCATSWDRIAGSGSTATTRANRPTSTRVSLPVPAPRSSTVAEAGRSKTVASRSTIVVGQPGRPRSYSAATTLKLRPWWARVAWSTAGTLSPPIVGAGAAKAGRHRVFDSAFTGIFSSRSSSRSSVGDRPKVVR